MRIGLPSPPAGTICSAGGTREEQAEVPRKLFRSRSARFLDPDTHAGDLGRVLAVDVLEADTLSRLEPRWTGGRRLHPPTRPQESELRIVAETQRLRFPAVESHGNLTGRRRDVLEKGRLMYNLDAYGSALGWLQLHVNGHPDFEASFRPHFRAADLYYQTITRVVPYADHFPFAAAGLAAVFHHRVNCNAGRFFHHRPDDDVSRVSAQVVARDVSVVATWLDQMASVERLPFTPGIPDADRPAIAACWDDLFGGWNA